MDGCSWRGELPEYLLLAKLMLFQLKEEPGASQFHDGYSTLAAFFKQNMK
jgi:hypothetical protein